MRLTEEEKVFIARRAAGEYAIIPAVTRIVSAHQKNRTPEDSVFLDYARWALKEKWSKADYLRLAGAVLEIIPEPFGTPWQKRQPEPVVEKKRRKTTRKKSSRKKPPKGKPPAAGLLDLLDS